MPSLERSEQVLIIEPANELTFTGPFTSAVSSMMKLTNPSEHKVCFKIKTTAPKRYCVKPNSGIIDPQKTVDIAVSLQPFDYDPTEKNRHKFMVQSMFAPDGDLNPDTLWKETESNQLMDSKLKCLFVLPPGQEASASAPPSTELDNVAAGNNFKTAPASSTASPKSTAGERSGAGDKPVAEEMKKLQEEISQLRQENIMLMEETLRQKRLAAAAAAASTRSGVDSDSCYSSAGASTTVSATAPDANALSTTYLYAALIILILGVILGKWIL